DLTRVSERAEVEGPAETEIERGPCERTSERCADVDLDPAAHRARRGPRLSEALGPQAHAGRQREETADSLIGPRRVARCGAIAEDSRAQTKRGKQERKGREERRRRERAAGIEMVERGRGDRGGESALEREHHRRTLRRRTRAAR